jgi:exodeoxyribonuclease V beta subunit
MKFEKNVAYEASAGSGKTFMLVVRYLSLLFMGANPSKILALTFTNKAANEMSQRIINALEELENRDELTLISQMIEISKEEILRRKQNILKTFLDSSIKIMTIDSFFSKILRKFSLYASLMPDFNTVSSIDEIKLLLRFLKQSDVENTKKQLINLSIESKKRMFELLNLLDDFYIKSKELSNFNFEEKKFQIYQEEAVKIVKKLQLIVESSPSSSKNALNAFKIEKFEDILSKSWLGRESLNYSTFSKCYVQEMDVLLNDLYDVLNKFFYAKEENFFYNLLKVSKTYQNAKIIVGLLEKDRNLGSSDCEHCKPSS